MRNILFNKNAFIFHSSKVIGERKLYPMLKIIENSCNIRTIYETCGLSNILIKVQMYSLEYYFMLI